MKAFSYKDKKIILCDCGGKKPFRVLWEYYYVNSNGIVFVIDSSNQSKLEESGQELIAILNNPILIGKPLLIFANKQDKQSSKDVEELVEYFGLKDLNGREWLITESSIKSGVGIHEGFFWLINRISHSHWNILK